jgi:hypothetical protein
LTGFSPQQLQVLGRYQPLTGGIDDKLQPARCPDNKGFPDFAYRNPLLGKKKRRLSEIYG